MLGAVPNIPGKAPRTMRLLMIGGEDAHFRLPLARALQEREVRVTVLGSCADACAFPGTGIDHAHYHLDRRLSLPGDIRSCRQLFELIRESAADIVHAFDTKPNLLVPLAIAVQSSPIVVRTITGLGASFVQPGIRGAFYRNAYRIAQRIVRHRCDLTVFQNRDDQNQFVRERLVRAERTCVVQGSGVDIAALDRLRATVRQDELREAIGVGSEPLVLMATRLIRQKGVGDYVDAARILSQRKAGVTMLLAGPLDENALDSISRQDLRDAERFVRYLGPRTDIPSLLSICELAVLPTYYREGIPRFLIEAAAIGKAIIACDVPGCRDIVESGNTGILIEPRNPRMLADAIQSLMASDTTRRKMGESGRRKVQAEMSLEKVATEYHGIYLDLVSRAASKS